MKALSGNASQHVCLAETHTAYKNSLIHTYLYTNVYIHIKCIHVHKFMYMKTYPKRKKINFSKTHRYSAFHFRVKTARPPLYSKGNIFNTDTL